MIYFRKNVIPQHPKVQVGKKDSGISEGNWRDNILHKYNNEGYKKVWGFS